MQKIILSLFILFLYVCGILAQTKNEETNTDIPELKELHYTIYQIWHNAWPNKDIQMLQQLIPEIDSGLTKLQKVQLPGILRERKQNWEGGLQKLSECVSTYKAKAGQKDSVGLLGAAEALHSQYEKMVRIVKPILKEINMFHQTLYMLYHYYYPDYNLEKIRESVSELDRKMQDLVKAKLPERLAERTKDFNKAVKDLKKSLNELKKAIKKDNKEVISTKIESLHSNYQALEAVFD
jgi:hypothetical protein